MRPLALALALSAWGCGPDPIDVAGPWSGPHNLIITGGETASGNTGIVVTQRRRELDFHFDGCTVKASADGETRFEPYDFLCVRRVNVGTWTLSQGRGSSIVVSDTAFNLTLRGEAKDGVQTFPFTWTFNGSR